MILDIDPKGVVTCLYSEAIDLRSLGDLRGMRASSVELEAEGQWCVDLAPVNGPRHRGFDLRSDALAWEQAWLERYRLGGGELN